MIGEYALTDGYALTTARERIYIDGYALTTARKRIFIDYRRKEYTLTTARKRIFIDYRKEKNMHRLKNMYLPQGKNMHRLPQGKEYTFDYRRQGYSLTTEYSLIDANALTTARKRICICLPEDKSVALARNIHWLTGG